MKTYKILHIMHNEKFITPFIEFIKEHFDFEEHFFIIIGGVTEDIATLPNFENTLILDKSYESKFNYFKYSKLLKPYIKNIEKIILHALLSDNENILLFFNQDVLSKCYWVIWGSDLYIYNKPRILIRDKIRHLVRRKIYSQMGHFITYVKGDYELAQKWYGVKGTYHECFMYPSNLYKEYDLQLKKNNSINIQLGNSADPSNNHIEVLEKLKNCKDKDIRIFTPLSYGNHEYAKKVMLIGKKIFGDKFIALTEFMSFDKYLEFLGNIDIAIFAHKRQQAMGNTISLLGLGKKVYIRSDISSWQLFKDIDIKVFNIDNIVLDLIDESVRDDNKDKVKKYFSEKNYLQQLKKIFKY